MNRAIMQLYVPCGFNKGATSNIHDTSGASVTQTLLFVLCEYARSVYNVTVVYEVPHPIQELKTVCNFMSLPQGIK